MSTTTAVTTQVQRVYINASAQRIWDAITQPEWTTKYGYACPVSYDLRPGGKYATAASPAMLEANSPDVIIMGEVLEVEPPYRLVQTWAPLFEQALIEEGARRLTWEIAEVGDGVCTLTVTHDVTDAPVTLSLVSGANLDSGGGWAMVVSDLKSLLETGSSMFVKQG